MKKKIIVSILVLVLISSVINAFAESEIRFNSIPWLTEDTEVEQSLVKAGYLKTDSTCVYTKNNSLYFVKNEILDFQPDAISTLQDVCYSTSLQGSVRGKIAGSPIEDLILSYAYDGEFKLISVIVKLIGADYKSIKEKLVKVYGECDEINVEDEGIISSIWKGDNSSGVMLYTENNGNDFVLMYGRLDADEILSNCLREQLDDYSGL